MVIKNVLQSSSFIFNQNKEVVVRNSHLKCLFISIELYFSLLLSILLDFMTIRVKIPNCVLQYSICFMLNSKGFEGEYLKIQIFKLKGNKSL